MKSDFNWIPTTDILGNKVKINDKAILFSKHGIAYEGIIEQIGGKNVGLVLTKNFVLAV